MWVLLAVAAVLLVGVTIWAVRSNARLSTVVTSAPATERRLPTVHRQPADIDSRSAADAERQSKTSVRTVGGAVSADPTSVQDDSGLADMQRAIVASTLDEVKRAVVKLEVPVDGGTKMESGCGFFVDGRGWIATNDHVIQNITSAARARLADGMVCEIEGIIARVPDRDLALLKLRERPYQVTLLDLQRSEEAKLGEQVYAFGHPYNADFSLSKGIVSRVLNTAELNEDAKRLLQSTIRTPDNVVWIQHDAKISPGNSGGPLIDEQGRVLGVNSFVHVKAEFGYASDVRYLRALVRTSEDKVTPLLPAGNVVQQQPSSELVQSKWNPKDLPELLARAERFHFRPDSREQYATLAALATGLTLSKHIEHQHGSVPEDAAKAAGRLADELVARLSANEFRLEQYESVNRFAKDVQAEPGAGLFAFATVVGRGPGFLILQVGEGGKQVLVRVGPDLAEADPLSRWLVLGVYSGQLVQVRNGDVGEAQTMRVLMMYYMLKT